MSYQHGLPVNKSNADKWNFSHYSHLNDIDIFARMIYTEAMGEPLEGKIGVAYIVHNRIKKDLVQFGGNTLRKVLLLKNMFDGLTTPLARRPIIQEKDWIISLDIAQTYIKYTNPIGNCLWFYSNPHYKKMTGRCFNNHIFLSNHCQEIVEYVQINKQSFFRVKGY